MKGRTFHTTSDAATPSRLLIAEMYKAAADAKEPPWLRTPPASLNEAALRAAYARGRVLKWVRISRFRGGSWQQIAVALRISRQAAWSRFRQQPIIRNVHDDERLLTGALKVLGLWGIRMQEAEKWTEELVHQARVAGWSWGRIGSELGVRRQTAWERFGKSRYTE